MKTLRLRVHLRDVTPTVVRVIDVPGSSTLPELHDVLQVALGWTDSHLHQFVTDDARYGVLEEAVGDEERDERGVLLKSLPAAFRYAYDFGDGWEHDVDVLGPGAAQPGCVYGEGDCPPEDCGGPGGYAELLEILADPAHEEYDERLAWAGDRKDFDQSAADLLVRRTVGEVPESVRIVLDLAVGGVKLTPGGRLPRAFVRQVQEQRPQWGPPRGPVSIEEDVYPLFELHGLLRRAGLLRMSKGLLRPTKAADDDLEVVRRLRAALDSDLFTSMLAGLTVAVLSTSGPQKYDELSARVLPLLGNQWASNGLPLTERDVLMSLYSLAPTLSSLDQVICEGLLMDAGPSAQSLLPRATALSQLL